VTTPDLRHVPPGARARVLADLDGGLEFGTGAWSFFVPESLWLHFLLANVRYLQKQDLYEATLVDIYKEPTSNLRHVPRAILIGLFRLADPKRLSWIEHARPEPPPTTLYRGVAGRGRARRVRGLSWTSALGCACWFALRYRQPDPAVFAIPFAPCQVVMYLGDRSEDEYVTLVPKAQRLRRVALTPQAMVESAEAYVAAREDGHHTPPCKERLR
jgi:hypothetical protein